MGLGDTLANTRIFEQGNWFKPGIYDVIVNDVSHFNSANGKGPMVAARFTVEQCQPTEYTSDRDFPPGSQASCVYVLQSQVGPSNLKAFLLAAAKALAPKMGKDANGVTPESLKAEDYDKLVAPNSPIKGLKMRATCFTKKSKKGTDFVAISWAPRTEG